MTDNREQGLLPAGFSDVLAPEAENEAEAVARLMAVFAAQGYRRVKPPLLEFEESLLMGPGAALAPQLFRLMDPISQRMMGLRADMTPQIARMVMARLGGAARPLRLCYTGQVLRVRGSQLRPERQFGQAGVELIGSVGVAGEHEVVALAAAALRTLGVPRLSIDLTLPRLVPAVAAALGLDDDRAAAARRALDAKDAGALARIPGVAGTPLAALLRLPGEADQALAGLGRLDLGAEGAALVGHLADLVAGLKGAQPDLTLTVDAGECRGFEYQTGFGFTVFAAGVRGELGRGGRYPIPSGEQAVGFTLYLDSILRALTPPAPPRRVYLPAGTRHETGRNLRADGWITVAALGPDPDPAAAARAQDCGHVWRDGAARALNDPGEAP